MKRTAISNKDLSDLLDGLFETIKASCLKHRVLPVVILDTHIKTKVRTLMPGGPGLTEEDLLGFLREVLEAQRCNIPDANDN